MRIVNLLSVVVLLTVIAGCVAPKNSGTNKGKSDASTVEVDNSNMTLADYLRRLPGVRVAGNGDVMVRGNNTIQGDSRPLYVVDGVRVGRDYYSVRNTVAVENIKNVRVVKGSEASSRYGMQGGSGVIVITTESE